MRIGSSTDRGGVMKSIQFNFKTVIAALAGLVAMTSAAAPTGAAKWLVLNPITYSGGVNAVAFDGIDKLLLTTLTQAKKYRCLDRDMYATAAREQGFGADVELVPAGYAISGEVVQLGKSGNSRQVAGKTVDEYVATVSLRVNDLRTQQPYEAETLRIASYCLTPKDMLVQVVNRTALALLTRDYPIRVVDVDDDELTLNYGRDFLRLGDRFEIRRRQEIKDKDTGGCLHREKKVGECTVTDVGDSTSTARLTPGGKVREDDVLRPIDGRQTSANPQSAAQGKPVIAVAPFISKRNTFSVYGTTIESRQWMDDASSLLITCLDRSGSFRTLDRTFGSEVDGELARIAKDPNASIEDLSRLSRKVTAEYLVVAEVTFADVVSPGADFATGLPLPAANADFAEVRYRCIHVPTSQLVGCSGSLSLNAASFGGAGVQFSSASAATAACMIADVLQQHFDPEGYARIRAERETLQRNVAPAEPAVQPSAQPGGVNLGF